MEPLIINPRQADRATLVAECERLDVAVPPKVYTTTLRKKLLRYQQDYLTFMEWRELAIRLMIEYGQSGSPMPMTAEGVIERANDILYGLLVAGGYAPSEPEAPQETKEFYDRINERNVRIISRQNARNVNVLLPGSKSGSYAIVGAARFAFDDVERIIAAWETWKTDSKGAL